MAKAFKLISTTFIQKVTSLIRWSFNFLPKAWN